MQEYNVGDILVLPSVGSTYGWAEFFGRLATMRAWLHERCGTSAKLKFHISADSDGACTLVVPAETDYLAFKLVWAGTDVAKV